MVKKKSMLSLVTTAAGAGLNIGLNFLLIPMMGVNGAALATFASYLFVFLLRAVSARWFIFIDYGTGKLIANTLLLAAQSACMLLEPPYWALLQAAFVPVSYTHLDVYKRQAILIKSGPSRICLP